MEEDFWKDKVRISKYRALFQTERQRKTNRGKTWVPVPSWWKV